MIWPRGDAPWTAEASTFCKSLSDSLGPNVVFWRLRWSGRNSHTARFNAAKSLRDCLQKGLENREWRDAKHFVVAHSHGGNVALMALENLDSRERIAGIAIPAEITILT